MQIQLYIIGNIKWMKFNFNFPTGNYELFYDRCTSMVTTILEEIMNMPVLCEVQPDLTNDNCVEQDDLCKEVVMNNSEAPKTQKQPENEMGISVETLQNYKLLADMIPELDILSIYFKLQMVFSEDK